MVDCLPSLCNVLGLDPRMTGKGGGRRRKGGMKGEAKVYNSRCLLPKVTDDTRWRL